MAYICQVNEQQHAMARFQILGINEDRDFCECCGKTDLKRVVWIQDNELGEIKHFGTVCAQQPVKGFGPAAVKEIKSAIRQHTERKHECFLTAWRMVPKEFKYALKNNGVYLTDEGKAIHAKLEAEVWAKWEATRKANEAERARVAAMTPEQLQSEKDAENARIEAIYGKWEDIAA